MDVAPALAVGNAYSARQKCETQCAAPAVPESRFGTAQRCGTFQPASASRTAGWQRYLDNFINGVGKGLAIAAPIRFPALRPGLWGWALGFCREKGAACRFAARSASSNSRRRRSFSFFNASISCSSCAIFSAVCSSATSTK